MIDDDDVRLEILDTAGQVRSYADVSRPGDGGGMGGGGMGGGFHNAWGRVGGGGGGGSRVRATSR